MDFEFLKQIGYTDHEIVFNAPLAERTWFKTGGSAACLLQPKQAQSLPQVLAECHVRQIPVFFLGDGSNLLVSDHGFNGLVIATRSVVPQTFSIHTEQREHELPSGLLVSDMVQIFCRHNQAGVQDFFGMPGTIGGATFMNARCYETEWSHVFVRAKVILPDGRLRIIEKNDADWTYKQSPFQNLGGLIESVTIRLSDGPSGEELWRVAQDRYQDREQKGHFVAPCAGSTFKNNRAFGQPSGKIIDSLGLRGHRIGGAQVSPHHANILINTGDALSQHIYDLAMHVQHQVKTAYGYELEPEVVFLGKF